MVRARGPRKCEPGVSSGKHLANASQVWVVARPEWGGVWAVGVVRARGGVGTHWQPLNTFSPSVGSGEEMRARWGAGGGGGESAGGCGHA